MIDPRETTLTNPYIKFEVAYDRYRANGFDAATAERMARAEVFQKRAKAEKEEAA